MKKKKLNSLELLKIISLSTLLNEPDYLSDKNNDGIFNVNDFIQNISILPETYSNKKVSEVMEQLIINSLSYDYLETIKWALVLRQKFNRKLTPLVIMVEAAIHPNRVPFNETNPGEFSNINLQIMSYPEDPIIQYKYYLKKNGKPNNLPNILKRNWAKKLETLTAYDLSKYNNDEYKIIDTIKICHAKSPEINELIQTGNIKIPHEFKTWKNLRANGYDWNDILEMMQISNNSIMMNLKEILNEVDDEGKIRPLLRELKRNVRDENHLPYRYYSAINSIINEDNLFNKDITIRTLKKCLEDATDLLPIIKGKTICLSDNSSSCNNELNFSYGNFKIYEINNLISLILAKNSEEGYLAKFNDKLDIFEISNEVDIIETSRELNENTESLTEDGLWLFLSNAIYQKEQWDNIIVFSDKQAAYCELSTIHQLANSKEVNFNDNINVIKIINEYRNKVNPKVNVFFVKMNPYKHTMLPENGYRTSIINGWNGKEIKYIKEINKYWDKFDEENKNH